MNHRKRVLKVLQEIKNVPNLITVIIQNLRYPLS